MTTAFNRLLRSLRATDRQASRSAKLLIAQWLYLDVIGDRLMWRCHGGARGARKLLGLVLGKLGHDDPGRVRDVLRREIETWTAVVHALSPRRAASPAEQEACDDPLWESPSLPPPDPNLESWKKLLARHSSRAGFLQGWEQARHAVHLIAMTGNDNWLVHWLNEVVGYIRAAAATGIVPGNVLSLRRDLFIVLEGVISDARRSGREEFQTTLECLAHVLLIRSGIPVITPAITGSITRLVGMELAFLGGLRAMSCIVGGVQTLLRRSTRRGLPVVHALEQRHDELWRRASLDFVRAARWGRDCDLLAAPPRD